MPAPCYSLESEQALNRVAQDDGGVHHFIEGNMFVGGMAGGAVAGAETDDLDLVVGEITPLAHP